MLCFVKVSTFCSLFLLSLLDNALGWEGEVLQHHTSCNKSLKLVDGMSCA